MLAASEIATEMPGGNSLCTSNSFVSEWTRGSVLFSARGALAITDTEPAPAEEATPLDAVRMRLVLSKFASAKFFGNLNFVTNPAGVPLAPRAKDCATSSEVVRLIYSDTPLLIAWVSNQ
jgi:hypothetical protein